MEYAKRSVFKWAGDIRQNPAGFLENTQFNPNKTHFMKIRTDVIFLITALLMLGCSKKKDVVNPDSSADQEHIILIPMSISSGSVLTALDGRTGMVKWEIPFLGDIKTGDKKLYLNQTGYNVIKEYADTVNLYANPPKIKNLTAIDAATGNAVQQVYNLLKPGFHLNCCHELQVNKLIGIANGNAYMALMFNGPFANGFPTVEKFIVYATELSTGSVKWTTDILTSEIPAFDNDLSMRVTDNKIYIGGYKYSYILDAATGKKTRSFSIGKLVDPIDGNFYPMDNDKIQAVDSESGLVKWQFEKNIGSSYTYPVVAGGLCFFGSSRGKLYAFDAATGNKKWERQFSDSNQGGFHQLSAENGMLFASYMNGKMFAIDQGTGNTQWESQIYRSDYIFPWNFEVKGDFIYAWALDNVVALEKKTGQKKWEKSMSGFFDGTPLVFDKNQLNF